MPSFRLHYSDPFGSGARPYLALHVTGPRGASGSILGLIDSGADSTCLPFGYAGLMGYEASDLVPQQGQSASGPMDTYLARKPAVAVVQGLTEPEFSFYPLFLTNTPTPLWGRLGLFQAFVISIDEVQQSFVLSADL